jgi:hypothetical protein
MNRPLYFQFRLRPIENGWILVIDQTGLRDEEHFSPSLEPLLEIIKKYESDWGPGRETRS